MRKFLTTGVASLAMAALVAAPAAGATSDPYRDRQWGLDRIQAETAWTTTTGTGALIAVVDTGVDLGHPDLQANLTGSGADFVKPGGDGAQDEEGHGTHVAGIAAAATNNGTGVAGTAPGASILPVRVLDETGSGTTEQVADGIRYAADQGADVINLSLGFLSGAGEVVKIVGALDEVYAAVDYAWSRGAVIAVAAGNDSVPLCAEPSAHPKALCVGATDVNDVRSWFSNSDATQTKRFMVAPGGDALTCASDIFSTYLRSAESFCADEAGYEAMAGTSMATPFVSGAAALLASQGLTNQQIVDCLLASADDLGVPGYDPAYGAGRLNAAAAVTTC